MSLLPSNPRDRRALLLLALALVAVLAYNPVIRPGIARFGEVRQRIGSERKALAAELGLLENQEVFPALYGKADSSLRSISPRLFPEQDDVLATVELQKYIDNVARSSSVLVTQANNQAAVRRRDGLKDLRVVVQAESDLEGILKFLDRLENGVRFVQVANLELHPGPSRSGIEQNENALMLQATIVGYGIDTLVARGYVAPAAEQRQRKAAQ